MEKANVIFSFDGSPLIIQCTNEDKMKDICLKFAAKVNSNLNSFLFLYGGNQLNFELKFKEQANSFDKINKEMKILVYKEGDDTIICPHCGKKIKLKTEKI